MRTRPDAATHFGAGPGSTLATQEKGVRSAPSNGGIVVACPRFEVRQEKLTMSSG